jgi:hypothetical protein
MTSTAASNLGLIDVTTDNAEALNNEFKEAKKNKGKGPKELTVPGEPKIKEPKLTGKQTANLIAQQQKQEGDKKTSAKLSKIQRYHNHIRLGVKIKEAGLHKFVDRSEAGVDAHLNDIRHLFSEQHIEGAAHHIVAGTAAAIENFSGKGAAFEHLFGIPVNLDGYGAFVAQNQPLFQQEEDEMAVEMGDLLGAPWYIRLIGKLGFAMQAHLRYKAMADQPISNPVAK